MHYGRFSGCKTINTAALEILETLSKELNLQIIFQTGKRNFDDVIKNLEEIYPDYKNDSNLHIAPYFDDMVTVLKASDIAVSRAGSLSISELCASSIAPILYHIHTQPPIIKEKMHNLWLTTEQDYILKIQIPTKKRCLV